MKGSSMADTNVTAVVVPAEDMEGAKAKAGENFELKTNVTNFSRSEVHVVETHFWHGRAVSKFPTLPVNTYSEPRQIGTLPEGVKYGFVYSDGDDTTARKFVVAIDGPKAKIYAEAGPIGPVDWNVVEVKLDQHSGSETEYVDPILGGKIVARINGTFAKAIFYN